MLITVMGVAGCGKSTVAQAIARASGATFIEGDAFHPQANIDKMSRGIPLDDEDRIPWIDALRASAAAEIAAGRSAVLACSALRRAHRERLRSGLPSMRFLWLDAPEPLLRARIEARDRSGGHYMAASMLASQFVDLERPDGAEPVTRIDVSGSPEEVVRLALEAVSHDIA